MTEVDPSATSTPRPQRLARERYPWHAPTWSALTRDLSRLPHALLLHGPAGLGKRAFAWRLTESLLCAKPGLDAVACGACTSCRRFSAGTHPDVLYVHPAPESATVTIDQIRDMREFVALKPHTAARKIVVLEPAEAMNLNAANALLKVLEEPPPGSVLLLVTPWLARLPATIRSRCALVPFRAPAARDAASWLREQGVSGDLDLLLRLTGGAPLRALALARSSHLPNWEKLLKDLTGLRQGTEDPLRCAARWKDYGAEQCLEWFQRYLAEFIRAEMEAKPTGQAGEKKMYRNLKDLFTYFDVLSEARSLVAGPLDQVLLLEDMLIRWTRLAPPMV